MLPQQDLDNLIAQTNYLASLFQTRQYHLIKKAYNIKDTEIDDQSQNSFSSKKLSNKYKNSEKNQEQSQKSLENQSDDFYSFFGHNFIGSQIYENEFAQRPTTYPRHQKQKITQEKMNNIEENIQLCFKAIQTGKMSFYIQQGFQLKRRLLGNGLIKPHRGMSQIKSDERNIQRSGKDKELKKQKKKRKNVRNMNEIHSNQCDQEK